MDEIGATYVDCTDTCDDWPDAIPNISDPPTRGALLEQVREAWGDPLAVVAPSCEDPIRWRFYSDAEGNEQYPHCGPTEGIAIARALMAAPKEDDQ